MVKKFKEFPGVEWVEGTGHFIKIDENKCIGCGNCVKVCLGGVFEIKNEKAHIVHLEKCMECASCWYVCQEDAISFTWPKGGTGYKSNWG
ncbi:MAG: 4Fe-4S dicluster domain-containing protein [Candidatus Lokiarchaeota archaeon]|nr:4Fe-4S dicluster domain-containing protein [Candidatus Lokiarchaeota archaeon]